ncbi:PAS domain-containing protein, partial [Candidatus Bipolaricaulota bacterium]|nr:PAS domain-containing protein [Candidatus Bipolaricaulota bacterium]
MDEHREARVLLICEDPARAEALDGRLAAIGFRPIIATFDDAIPKASPPQLVLVSVAEDAVTDLERLGDWADGHPSLDAIAWIDTDDASVGVRALAAGASCWLPASLSHEELTGILELALDKQTRRARLAADRRRIWNLLRSAPIGVFELTDGRISFVNGYMLTRLGYELDELVGQRPDELDLVTLLERPQVRRAIEERHRGVVASKPSVYHFTGKDGTSYIGEVWSQVVDTPDGPRMEGTVRDITLETRLTRLQRIVLELGEVILGEERIDEILQLVLDTITEYGGFRRVVLSLFDLSIPIPFEGETYTTLTSGLTEDQRAALLSQPPMSAEERRVAFSEE